VTNRKIFYGVLFLLIWAIILRVISYFQGIDFILDEANLARNIYDRSWPSLFSSLGYEQHAPILFLLIIKSIGSLIGFSEEALKLWPFLAGCLALFLWLKVLILKKYNAFVIVVGFIILAFNIVSVKYSLIMKQYSTDLMLAVLFLCLYYVRDKKLKRLWEFVGGSLAIFLSMPVIFILLWYSIAKWSKSFNKVYLKMAITWALIFTANYFLFLRPSVSSNHLQSFHEGFFMPFPTSIASLKECSDRWIMLFTGIFGKTFLALSVGIGLVLLGVFQNKKNWFLALPILFTIGAALIQKYSLIERLMLFSYPFFILLFLEGLQSIIQRLVRNKTLFAYSGLFVVSFISVIILSSSDRFVYWPNKKFFGNKGIEKGMKIVGQFSPDPCIVLTHNAAPFYDYYQRIKENNDQKLDVLSWDHRELTETINRCDTLIIVDAHTFGFDKEKLNQILAPYKKSNLYSSPDLEIISVEE
jgi:hypothetical protein